MNIAQIEINLQKLIKTLNKENFIYDLLLAYDLPKASITRLKKGNLNLSKVEGELSWKKKLFFREEYKEDLHLTISEIAKGIKHNERFVIVSDYETLLAIDTKTNDKLDCAITDLSKHYDFFLPWAGMEKAQHQDENPADVKAAEKMAKLYDEIKKDNPDNSSKSSSSGELPETSSGQAASSVHGLNVFLSRLLFCFFAEDTHIFEENQFTNAIDSNTQKDGSDLNTFIDSIFYVLNTPKQNRENITDSLNAFPYVNGALFEKKYKTPKFSRSSRAAILNSGDQNWSAINPDIFGSMFQAVIGAEQRGSLGQHYTSVPNIMKVIEPLFLNELYEEFDASASSATKLKKKKLNALLNRIHNLKIFDPACGSGNFLIIAYKELRILEMKIFKAGNMMALSGIQLSQFYGIEIDDFAGEIAKLALWLAEHQMNVEFFKEFGRTSPTLPLSEAGHIVQGNATRLNWEEVCPKTKDSEIYILGNPPYLGGKSQSKEQKEDMQQAFGGLKRIGELDYISCWYYKASIYKAKKSAFVTTNSIFQGAQVQQLWPLIFEQNQDITFAYKPFYWSNNAKNKAAVIVTIVAIGESKQVKKYLFDNERKKKVVNISPYLIEGRNLIITQSLKSISSLPQIITGNSPYDGGNLILSDEEKENLYDTYPSSKNFIKRLYGSFEFINNRTRWCLWVENESLHEAQQIPEINERILRTKAFREQGGEVARGLINRPHQFRYRHKAKNSLILIPRVSSERRKYIPFGFLNSDCVVSDSAQAIYDCEAYIFGIISSKFHMVWAKTVSGKLKSDYRYSSALTYNTFPFPPISTQRKNEITQATFRILEEREKHSDKTLAQLYDPDKMPEGLREAHRQNDEIIEKCYRSTPFKSDEERLEYLFKLYEKMIAEEKEQGTLFAKENLPAGKAGKTRKKRK